MKLKSKLSITREYRLCERLIRSNTVMTAEERAELRGVQQALAWALNDNAMRPVKAATYRIIGRRITGRRIGRASSNSRQSSIRRDR